MDITTGSCLAGVTPPGADSTRPLVVDLDGTLIRGDLLVESLLELVAHHPVDAARALGALGNGKGALKAFIAERVTLNPATMPLNPSVVTLIEQRRAAGGKVILASASDQRYVTALADHLGLFDAAIGSTPTRNLAGSAKADDLISRFGSGGFDYIGNAKVDLAIWRHATTAYVVNANGAVERRLHRTHAQAITLPAERGGIRPYIKALRPHQWLKNLLIFLPAAANHSLFPHMATLLLAFLAFSLCASSVYIINDLLDIPGDRDHHKKRHRPFASGAAQPLAGMVLAAALLVASFALSGFVGAYFLMATAGYFCLTLAYSLVIKRRPIIDVLTLACLYGMRVIAGGFAIHVPLSLWLEAMSVFLFLALALIKRCSEITARIQAGKGELVGRGYQLSDLSLLEAMAVGASYNAVLVLALYISSAPERLAYAHPHRLSFLCLLLLAWLSYISLLTRRGKMNEDPVIFAFRDRWSLAIGLGCGLVILSALVP